LRVFERAWVEVGDTLAIIESMKMELAVLATARGVVRTVVVKPGQTLRAGDLVCVLEEA